MTNRLTAEDKRLKENYSNEKKWLKWGPYLSERQWGTVREDYSANGDAWDYVTHSQSRSKTYRWGEDGIAGISDNFQRICFALALWNGKDEILKERLFGLTPKEANHGEDVKELYYYVDNTPSHAYMKHLYKYPQDAFPYHQLIAENKSRNKFQKEFEINETGLFKDNRYFDVFTEYAKADDEDICIRITVFNRGNAPAKLSLLPTTWFRNTWQSELNAEKPVIVLEADGTLKIHHPQMDDYTLYFEPPSKVLFTENETNTEKIYNYPNSTPFVKDVFHDAVIQNDFSLFDNKTNGTKCSLLFADEIKSGGSRVLKLRLSRLPVKDPLGKKFDLAFKERMKEANEFYATLTDAKNVDLQNIQRQAYSGMLWNKQFYYLDIPRWLNGDPGYPPPPPQRKRGRNSTWITLNNQDILSMPDKWEYPWYATWDVAFHCITLAKLDMQFAKDQLILLLREWYMDPNGQLPAYEWSFGDVNPPVHAWSCMEVYKMDKEKTGVADTSFLERTFQKLLINFTWWVNRKDHLDNNVFEGGFLGLDNIGVFDRSNDIPGNGILEQADGTAWMGMYCLNMLEIALELAQYNNAYEDLATKFFEHFTYIASSINHIGEDWAGSWDEQEGFFYDVLNLPGDRFIPVKVRSLVGLTTLFAVHVISKDLLEKVPEFHRRLKWFLKYRKQNKQYQVIEAIDNENGILLSLVPKMRLQKILTALLDENEFLATGGIRSLSKIHETPYNLWVDHKQFGLNYEPGESNTNLFGGNSNWRGPIWMPMNFLIIQSLEKYYSYYEQNFEVEFPSHSGFKMNLKTVADELINRLTGIFISNEKGERKLNGDEELFKDEHFRDLVLFYEYFHGDNARGLGASHQTGWTGLIANLISRRQG